MKKCVCLCVCVCLSISRAIAYMFNDGGGEGGGGGEGQQVLSKACVKRRCPPGHISAYLSQGQAMNHTKDKVM